MSLISALNSTTASLRTIEAQMTVTSNNVTNADKAGYTTKTYQSSYITANGTTTPSGGVTVGSISKTLYASAIKEYSASSYYSVISEYLDYYSTASGTTDGGTSISAKVDSLTSALETLAASPDDTSAQTGLVTAASDLALTLNSLSSTLQSYRDQADSEISSTVDSINEALNTLNTLNEKITSMTAQGQSTADLEDQRMQTLLELSEMMEVNYYFTSNNELRIYTSAGQPLLDSSAHTLSFVETSTVNSATVYPDSLSGVYVNGVDITSTLGSGTLGGLIAVRDTYLVEEQQKLDELASVLADTLNTISNSGTAYPARNSLTAETAVSDTAAALSASGVVRIAVVDSSGTVQSYQDLDLSSYATYDDLAAAIDGIDGLSASFDAEGALVITADSASNGIAINQMTSSIGGEGFSSYFGLNNIFSGSDAGAISISDYLSSSSGGLPVSTLSSSSALAVGDRGISSADGTVATALSEAMDTAQNFSSAGNFSAQKKTLSTYAAQIVSNVAQRASSAESESEVASSVYSQAKSLLDNSQGVNLDEQTILLTTLENQYQSTATLLQTIQSMFDALIDAVS